MAQGKAAAPGPTGLSALGDRLAALFAFGGRAATGFVSQPEPKTIGSHARGRQLLAGNFLFAGRLVEAPGQLI